MKNSIDDLIGATTQVSTSLETANCTSQATQESISSWALELLANHFLDEVGDEEYIKYVFVLEDDKKASTFLSLVKTSSKKICLMWLKKEATGH